MKELQEFYYICRNTSELSNIEKYFCTWYREGICDLDEESCDETKYVKAGVLGDGWCDARKELPKEKNKIYLIVFTDEPERVHLIIWDGQNGRNSFVMMGAEKRLYTRAYYNSTEDIKAWRLLPAPPAFA